MRIQEVVANFMGKGKAHPLRATERRVVVAKEYEPLGGLIELKAAIERLSEVVEVTAPRRHRGPDPGACVRGRGPS